MSAAETETLLRLRDVSIQFRGVRALDAVSVDVRIGGVTALIGPNGAGKTTLFNCVTGLSRATGQISFAGTEITGMSVHDRSLLGIARTFQTPALVDGMTVADNVLIGTQSAGFRGIVPALLRPRSARQSYQAAAARADELLTLFGLTDHRFRLVDTLPHGVRRRVEIVRALLSEPRLVLLDEPAAGLDPAEAFDLCRRLTEYAAATGITLLLVEHSVALVMELAHTVLVLDAGRLIATGPPEHVRADPRVIEAYLGEEIAHEVPVNRDRNGS